MKTIALALAAFLMAASASAAFLWQLRELQAERQREEAATAERAMVARDAAARQVSFEKKLEDLSRKVAALEARGPAAGGGRASPAGLAGGAAVAGEDTAVSSAGAAVAEEPAETRETAEVAKAEERIQDYLDELHARETPRARRQAIWNEIREAGLLDRAIEEFENRARESPRDPDRKSELGLAYLQKVFGVNDLEKGAWAAKADRAFDEALAINPAHWEARFQKAISLSYWPPIMGKQPEAIRQFETLLSNQEALPARPEFAQTYIFLGNLYHQKGERDKAAETWRKGAGLFPQNRELAQKISEDEGK